MGRKKPTRLRANPARLTTTRTREDDKDDRIGNPFLLLFQGQDCLTRTRKMFSVEYKPGVSQGGSVICPIASLFCYDLSASTNSSSQKRHATFPSPSTSLPCPP